MSLLRSSLPLLLIGWLLLGSTVAWAQLGSDYDPSWYESGAPHIQFAVVEDGVYRVEGRHLQNALPQGVSLTDLDPESIRLIENGQEIPIQVNAEGDVLTESDAITFIGRRSRGDDELWAYNGDASAQSSAHRSLYSDTTYYWMTWGGENGLRYNRQSSDDASSSPTTALRDTVRAERDNRYYHGRPSDSGHPLYTESEGYYWRRFSHTSASSISFSHTLPVGRRTQSSTELDLDIRLDGGTNSCHRVEIEAELRQGNGTLGYETLRTVEWNGFQRTTVEASVVQDRIPSGGLDLQITSHNQGFSNDDCPDPSSTPNHVLLDWIEAVYTRSLDAHDDRQRFVAPSGGGQTFELTNYASDTVHVYNPVDKRHYAVPNQNGGATVVDTPSTSSIPYWAMGADSFQFPADILPDASSNWGNADAHGADYVILTTETLLPSARQLAEYRRSQDGYQVEVALVQDVFDEFDYGRPTPIAIRRFVHATQDWNPAPDFLAIFGDAQYPIRDGSVSNLHPEWSVPSFGYAPSDSWFAMRMGEDADSAWTERLAIGRIPVRSVAQGNKFLEKLESYEAAPLERWQKRMPLLAGGTSESEQQLLQNYSNRWGEIASAREANTRVYSGPVHTGMDTLRYYKSVDDPLDSSFQDSLAADLRQGVGWLNYFGHSAAQTWEIVTDPPSEFDNADRLPVVVSLACKTGAFAGGRYEIKDAPSLGEELVVGRTDENGTPQAGAENGSIAHWGSSALGSIRPSARLNSQLVKHVFVDTMRVLGRSIRQAKAEIAASHGQSSQYVRHLLQYGLIGDPALHINLPEEPDFHLEPSLLSSAPSTPTPGDSLDITARLRNHGLIPRDSLTLDIRHENPRGEVRTSSRRLPPFALEQSLTTNYYLDEQSIGSNRFRFTADPEDEYPEANETNNETEQRRVVFRTGVDLIHPREDGLVTTRRPTLRHHLIGGSLNEGTVVIELDTTDRFDSPALQQTRLSATDYVLDWTPRPLAEGTTYHWRARLDSDQEPQDWTKRQFTLETESTIPGWLQQDTLLATNPVQARLNYEGNRWSFDTFPMEVLAFSERGSGSRNHGFTVAGTQNYERIKLGFGVLVIDDKTGEVRDHASYCTYDVQDQHLDHCTDELEQEEAVTALEAFIDDVEPGNYVFTRTRHLGRAGGTIGSDIRAIFRTLGTSEEEYSAAIDSLTYQDLWLMQARKGHPEETVEAVDPSGSGENEIQRTSRLDIPHASGQIMTDRIGPSRSWDTLAWDASASSTTSDVQIEVLADDGTTVLDRLDALDASTHPLTDIDASEHPYLRLRATLTDSTEHEVPQLQQWQVTYAPTTEIAADARALQAIPDTLDTGAPASLEVPIRNLSGPASGPVTVDYHLTDGSNQTTTVARDTLDVLSPDEEATSSVSFTTTDRTGDSRLAVEIDHDGPPEPIRYNNTLLRNFYIAPDREPPSLEVFVEGRELPNNPDPITNLQDPSLPFVSTTPTIEILASDDNAHIPLSDTSLMTVQIDEKEVPFSSSSLQFEPGTEANNNEAQIVFTPDLSGRDTTHTLKVEAEDPSGNAPEDPYQAHFRVQQEQLIRDLYPYPNPMNTHTTFAFRVEGGRSETLRNFRLRIYTLSGRLVRELDETDLRTPLRVGWNHLDWNGRDQDGDRVASGVYLYRVHVEGDKGPFRGDVEKIAVIR